MSATPFMPLWIGDFLTKTIGLDTRETGAYLLLLMAMWTNGGTLPEDHKKLQRIARAGRDWPTIWQGIAHFFTVADGVLSNKRLTEELQKAQRKSLVNSQSGARGGKAKALKEKEQRLANATISPQQSYSESYRGTVGISPDGETPTAEAPKAEPPADPAKLVFDSGVALLRGARIPDGRARTIVGGWRKRHADAEVIAAIGAAQREGAVDPVSYVEGCLKARVRSPPARSSAFGTCPEVE